MLSVIPQKPACSVAICFQEPHVNIPIREGGVSLERSVVQMISPGFRNKSSSVLHRMCIDMVYNLILQIFGSLSIVENSEEITTVACSVR